MREKVSKQFWAGKKQLILQNKMLVCVLLFGTVSWYLTMVKSGMPIATGIGFWGANGHDGVWHIALANSLARGSFEMPVFAGALLQNYHLGFDLILAFLYKITTIPVQVWYFQILPVLFAFLIGFLTIKLVFAWTGSKGAAIWSSFFVYFGGSFGYVVTALRGQGIGGESLFWSQQSISTLINPPFALSLIILLAALLSFERYLCFKKLKDLFLSVILFSLLLSIKVYAGVLALGSLMFVALYLFLFQRRYHSFFVVIPSIVLSLALFLPFNTSAGQLILFQPGWFLETMLALSDRFYWPKLFEAIINWRAGHVYIKAIGGYIVAFFLFIIGNFGTRIVTFFSLLFLKRKGIVGMQFSPLSLFFIVLAIGGVSAPMLFLQAGTAWNTIQFFYYSLFACSILSGIAINQFLNHFRGKLKYSIAIGVVVLTLPTSVSTLAQVYLPSRPPAQITTAELEALDFLRKQPQGSVLTFPFDRIKANEAISNPPRPLYLYESTAYVAAYGNQPVYLEDEVNLTIMNYQWKTRREDIDLLHSSTNQKLVYDLLRSTGVTYIYWVKPQFTQIGDLQLKLLNIFENKEVIIYRVLQ